MLSFFNETCKIVSKIKQGNALKKELNPNSYYEDTMWKAIDAVYAQNINFLLYFILFILF